MVSMPKTNGFTAEKFILAIPGTGGVISPIATRVNCAWHTAKKYIDEYPTIRQAYLNEKHKVDDKAISNIYKAIGEGDLSTSMWWVKMKLGDEFHETHRVNIGVNWDDDNDKE